MRSRKDLAANATHAPSRDSMPHSVALPNVVEDIGRRPPLEAQPGRGHRTKVLSHRAGWFDTVPDDVEVSVPQGRARGGAIDALVTGGTGFVGGNVAREFAAAGPRLTVMPSADRSRPAVR